MKHFVKKIKKLLSKPDPECSVCGQSISEYDLISTSKKDSSFILCYECAKIYKESYPHYLESESLEALKDILGFHQMIRERAYENLRIAQRACKIASCQIAAIEQLIAEDTP